MTPEPRPVDLEPFSASGYAWRWRNPKYDVLPDDILQAIHAVRHPKAQDYFQPSLNIDRWVRAQPAQEITTDDHEEDAVAEWLGAGTLASQMVIASWSEDEAIYLPWSVFRKYWSSFCYPSSDDVTVWPVDESFGLSYSHIGVFHWRSRDSVQA
jgi:hypothetical protein